MSYPPLPVPLSTTKSHPHQPTHFITHRLPLLLILSFAFLLTLTIVLLLPITGPQLLGTARSCPYPPHQSLGQQQPHPYILSSFRENPLNEASRATTQENDKKDPWEATLIPPTSGGGIFATHLDALTEADVQRVDPNRTHSGTLDRSYGIAMFHQLHCMGALRGRIFPDAVHGHEHGHSGSSDGEKGSESEKEKQIKEHDHLQHCFNYILQSILCSASDTIERPKHITPHGRPMWHIDGIGDVHRCRDTKVLWTVSEQSLLHPVDMRTWKGEEGVGVREFFG